MEKLSSETILRNNPTRSLVTWYGSISETITIVYSLYVPKWKLRRIFMQFHFFSFKLDCSIVRIYLAFIMYLHMQILRKNLVVQISSKHWKIACISRTRGWKYRFTLLKSQGRRQFLAETMPRETEANSLSTRTMQLAKCQEHYSLHIVDVADIRPTNMRD